MLATPETIDHSPETIARLWAARTRGETIDLTAGGKPSVTLSPKTLE